MALDRRACLTTGYGLFVLPGIAMAVPRSGGGNRVGYLVSMNGKTALGVRGSVRLSGGCGLCGRNALATHGIACAGDSFVCGKRGNVVGVSNGLANAGKGSGVLGRKRIATASVTIANSDRVGGVGGMAMTRLADLGYGGNS